MITHFYKILGIVLLAYSLFITYQCNDFKGQSFRDAEAIVSYKSRNQQFQSIINSKDQRISTQNKVIARNSKELQELLQENSGLKKITKQIALESETKIKNIIASYTKDTVETFIYDTVEVDKPIGVKFDTEFNLTDKWYSVAGKVKQEGIVLDSLSFVSDMVINIGYSKDKWYKKLEPKVEIIENNPYTATTNLNNLTVTEDKKWYQRPLFWFLSGAVATTMLNLNK